MRPIAEEDDPRVIWRDAWFSVLLEMSDIELQRKMWLDPSNTNPHWSFVELRNLFDLHAWGGAHRHAVEGGYLSAIEAEAVSQLCTALDSYDAPRGQIWDNGAILADPRWHDVVRLAKAAVRDLQRMEFSPDR